MRIFFFAINFQMDFEKRCRAVSFWNKGLENVEQSIAALQHMSFSQIVTGCRTCLNACHALMMLKDLFMGIERHEAVEHIQLIFEQVADAIFDVTNFKTLCAAHGKMVLDVLIELYQQANKSRAIIYCASRYLADVPIMNHQLGRVVMRTLPNVTCDEMTDVLQLLQFRHDDTSTALQAVNKTRCVVCRSRQTK